MENVMKTIKLSGIVISDAFLNSHPSENKIKKYREAYAENKQQSKYIVLNNNNVLLDGYIQYLILKENNVEDAKFIRRRVGVKERRDIPNSGYRDKTTIYVYGTHPNSNCDKEFVWRVPNNWDAFAENIKVGDTIYCNTKFGVSPVVISKIETLDECPISLSVKKVASKTILHR